MSATTMVPREAGPVRVEWLRLAEATVRPEPFSPEMTAGLPEAARRWLGHAIAPGTPLWQTAELSMHGQIRIGRWRPFTATQVISPPHGYIWAATARVAGLPVTGYDRLTVGSGEMRWRLLHILPLVTASGTDVTRSACGRLASEITLIPTAFGAATWAPGERPGTVTATWQFGRDTETASLRIGDDGRLLEIMVNRWGNPGGAPYGRYPFGASVESEAAFGGITIPAEFRVGWWWGTGRQGEGEFFRARITGARFR
jgi:hypothetical protein